MADMASASSALRLGIAIRQLPFNPSISRRALVAVPSRRSLSLRIAKRGELGAQVCPGPWRSSWRAVCVPTMGVEKVVETPVKVVESIHLTEQEEKIFEVLVATLQHFGLDTELRVAGGWVRDKLLGKDSHDIDIAIDNMLGKQFCEKINEYRSSIGEETSKMHIILRNIIYWNFMNLSMKEDCLCKFQVLEWMNEMFSRPDNAWEHSVRRPEYGLRRTSGNPEQSKHLETATMRVKGMLVDFVNLRAETYAQNSRIPTMEFGTAEQDALRRDLTINSLFYNINKRCVEDLTSRGLKDLKSGIIRTPLPSKETFLDDPLRVMRALRFGARFGFELEDKVKEAASCDEVRTALGSKVSRERIGHEIDLMLRGKKPLTAMRLVEQLQLFPVIFTNGISNTKPPLEENIGRLCVDHMEAIGEILVEFEGAPSSQANFSDEERRLFHLSSLLLPLRHVAVPQKKGMLPVSELIIKESLKLKADDAKKVVQLHTAAEKFVNISELFLSEVHDKSDEEFQAEKRVQAGLLLGDVKGLWRLALVLSSVLSVPLDEASATERANNCLLIETAILRLVLDNVWTRKPLFDGKKVMSLLGLQKGGPQVKEWMGKFHKWELAHPDGTEEQCLDWFQGENVKRLKSH